MAEMLQTTVVAAGDVPAQTSAVAVTPGTNPDIVVNVVRPALALVVRFCNAFLTTWAGLVVAAMTPAGGRLLYTTDFLHTAAICASLAFPGAAVALIKDLVTIFGKLETKFPLMTGNV